MHNYSIVMPAYLRLDFIKKSLLSIFNQDRLPLEIIIVDNNTNKKASQELKTLINSFSNNGITIKTIKSLKNSGAIARNMGVKIAEGDLIAFLDSDVILYPNYYSNLLKIFDNNLDIVAAQGTDQILVESEKVRLARPFYKNLFHNFEQLFETSTLLNKKRPFVSPSMAISHPDVTKDFYVETEWISTCAGVFRRNIFDKYSFPKEFVTYSNNEYLFLSYSLFLKNEGIMIYTSEAKYKNIQTEEGRIPKIPLIYQIEVNDLFIFILLFPKNAKNILIFIKSRIGHLIYNLLYAVKNKIFSPIYFLKLLWAPIYPFINIVRILKKDLTFYERDFVYKE